MARQLAEGMGQAVAERTILRRKLDGEWETWDDVAQRVALGNSLLAPTAKEKSSEYQKLYKVIGDGQLLTSGRHLQHGDVTQPERNQEVFTNCATSITTFGLVYLLLNGSGVGRCYDDDLMLVDWDHAPNVLCVLDSSHPDFDFSAHESARDARHKYGNRNVVWHTVKDSREGWGSAVELVETMASERIHRDTLLILDFSEVRPKGSPIGGMQGRPASGPVPLMNAFARVASLKGAGMPRWMQAMYVDHYFADCVLVGGVRRSARMSVKFWKDSSIFEFITVKRPIEFEGKTPEQIAELRKTLKPQSFLWSSNNSVLVDKEFWDLLRLPKRSKAYKSDLAKHARKVFQLVTECAYHGGTGEPGFINVDQLTANPSGVDEIKGDYFKSKKYQIGDGTTLYLDRLLRVAKLKQYCMIVNPCSEIAIALWGAFCVIADVCPFHCDKLEDCEAVFRAAVRFLIRVNLLDSVYNKEVKRTNRIGVGLTGIHEFAWKFFGLAFRDLIDELKSIEFWKFLSKMKRAVRDEAQKYSKKLGVECPHTDTTIKPSGTISKLFGLTEGWHLPAMKFYMRWVQFDLNNPLVQKYRDEGYQVRELKTYRNTAIVGFPTVPIITQLVPPELLVTAAEATPEEQYKWLVLGEKYWMTGVDEDGTPLPETGNQISYTLKYGPSRVSYEQFRDTLLEYQSRVRCCSVMPQEDQSAYEYLPEEPVSQAVYQDMVSQIKTKLAEDVDKVHIDCAGGACPVDFHK